MIFGKMSTVDCMEPGRISKQWILRICVVVKVGSW
jgi:hypothetical protein